MTECPLEHHVASPWLKEEPVGDFASCYVEASIRGKQVLDRLLVLLSSHLKSQPSSRVSPFTPALLLSICDVLQLDHAESSVEQSDTFILPLVLNKLRGWRLLDPDYRYSPKGIHELAVDLAGITDEVSIVPGLDLGHTTRVGARLRVKWVGSDSPSECQDRESSSPTPPSPSSSRSGVLDSAQECARALLGLNKRRSDTGYESCQASRLGTPDSEDSSAVVSTRRPSASEFRSGCSACRHPRLSGPTSPPPSPRMTSGPSNDINLFDTSLSTSVTSPRLSRSSTIHVTPRTKREQHRSTQSVSHGADVDENEPPLPKPIGVQQDNGISFPRQCTHSPRISNALLPPSSPVPASVQQLLEPNHSLKRTRQGDKRTSSHRVASVDLRLSIANSRPSSSSPNDLRSDAPTRAQSFSYSPAKSHGVGSIGALIPKLLSNVVGSRLSKRLPSWSQTHPTTTTTSVRPTRLSPPLRVGKTRLAISHPHRLGTRSRPTSTSIPGSVPSELKHRDRNRRSVSFQTHKHSSSVGVLPSSRASPSPLSHARKWQV